MSFMSIGRKSRLGSIIRCSPPNHLVLLHELAPFQRIKPRFFFAGASFRERHHLPLLPEKVYVLCDHSFFRTRGMAFVFVSVSGPTNRCRSQGPDGVPGARPGEARGSREEEHVDAARLIHAIPRAQTLLDFHIFP